MENDFRATQEEALSRLHSGQLDALPPPPTDETSIPATNKTVSFRPVDHQPAALGDYELLEEIDRGGMGVVFKARQKSLDRVVAVKMILAGNLANGEDVQRFQAEAEAAARLRHPGIVAIYDVGEHKGRHFFSMDLIEGMSLAERAREQPFSPGEAAGCVRNVAEAVEFAHQRGVLHRDLKPSNILLDADGRPKITDFGLAKRIGANSDLTGTGQALGTPGYMPPEQAQVGSREISPVSDVYSLGAILYELLTGRPPFRAESVAATLVQLLENEPVPPRLLNPSVPLDLDTICRKCLEKLPENRYESAVELAAELDRFLHGRPIHARPVSRIQSAWRWCKRNPWTAGFLMAATALILLLAVGGPLVAVREATLRDRVSTAERNRIDTQIESLRRAAPQAIPVIVAELQRQRSETLPKLHDLWNDSTLTPAERTRICLPLLSEGPEYVAFSRSRLLEIEVEEFGVLREALADYHDPYTADFWRIAETAPVEDPRLLRAAGALAAYDPAGPRWSGISQKVTDALVRENSLTAGYWAGYFRPVEKWLKTPLYQVACDHNANLASQRMIATDILVNYTADDPQFLVRLLKAADARQFTTVFQRLEPHGNRAIEILFTALDESLDQKRTPNTDEAADAASANLAIALLRMGKTERCRSLLRLSPDPTIRSHLIHRLAPLGAGTRLLVDWLKNEEDVSIRRALILALGETDKEQWQESLYSDAVLHLAGLYGVDPDTGVHAACEWTLRQWGEEKRLDAIRGRSLSGDPKSPLQRFVTSEGQVMTVVRGPVEYQSRGRTVRIDRSFAFAIKEVTREEYMRFENDPQIQAEIELQRKEFNTPNAHWHNASWVQSFGPDPECPHLSIPWTVAARYCRWLSEKEGIPPEESCFVPVDSTNRPALLVENYLDRTGYRLPTAAEWEYMCLGGTETERYCGRGVSLLPEYAWYAPNADQRTWPVGRLKPNDHGLFDMFGNIREWCLNRRGYRPRPNQQGIALDEEETNLKIDVLVVMLTCGGGYTSHSRFVRASSREHGTEAWAGNNVNGFRLARTLKPEKFGETH